MLWQRPARVSRRPRDHFMREQPPGRLVIPRGDRNPEPLLGLLKGLDAPLPRLVVIELRLHGTELRFEILSLLRPKRTSGLHVYEQARLRVGRLGLP